MTNEYLSENSEFLEQSATNANLEKPASLNSSEVEIANLQEVENVFTVLSDKVIHNNKYTNKNDDSLKTLQRKIKYLYTTTNKFFWLNLCFTGCLSFMILAFISSRINSTATLPKTNILLK
ncbi:MAG: hypothetical protein KME05_16995 [Gloeocapsa sp. UFS-A4-WI-NPMV-4B04]|jgi:hypothetical protein|nr:hypothetical protein [Gloeocapsa sp. UFS-A4-WI-NPMV-4B04]